MVRSRNMVGAFLEIDDKILMLYRSADKALEPSKWTGIGGHIDASEINDPLAACLREIQEESGIEKAKISSLELRYITINNKHGEVRIAYYFFGRITVEPKFVADTREGHLQWVAKSEILSYDLSNPIRIILEHWLHNSDNGGDGSNNGCPGDIHVCIINNETGQVNLFPI